MKVYLASPLFNEEENMYIDIATNILRERNIEVWSPREHETRNGAAVGTAAWARETFLMDREAITNSDAIVCLYHGNYSDSGTAWELGFASAWNIPIILVHFGNDSNLMCHCSAVANIHMKDLYNYDFSTMPKIEYEGKMF